MTRKVKGENGYAPTGNVLKELQAQITANSKAIEDLQGATQVNVKKVKNEVND